MASAISIEVQPAAMTSKRPFSDLLAILSRSGYSSCRLREFCSASQSVAPLGFVAAGSRAAFSSRPRRSATAGCSMASAISIEVQPAAMTSKGPFGDLLAIVSRSGYSSCRLREFCSASQSVAPLGFVSDVAPSRRQPGERSRRADAGTQSILAGRLALDASTSSWARLA